jgi:hypothetical protein
VFDWLGTVCNLPGDVVSSKNKRQLTGNLFFTCLEIRKNGGSGSGRVMNKQVKEREGDAVKLTEFFH